MIHIQNLLGCKTLIRNEADAQILAETPIIACDTINVVVTVNGEKLKNFEGDHVSLLIFGKDFLYEYRGTIRKVTSTGTAEIALFKGKEKEERGYRRYAIKSFGKIMNVRDDTNVFPLANGIEIMVENISATGILFKTVTGNIRSLLKEGNQVQIVLMINGNRMEIDCIVVHIDILSETGTHYGCKFMNVEKTTR